MSRYFKAAQESPAFLAGDATLLQEIAHPLKDNWPIGYSLAKAQLDVGQASLPHRLKSSELYYVISGAASIFIDGQEQTLQAGDCCLVPAQAEQYVQQKGDQPFHFLCIVEPYWQENDEDIL
ncbi:cupin domain-containing protein [Saprospira grandis]|uniref:cupin domain-containing protein n=1 Tax=Saprospira grandis TaxID=1008 RepID=UPI0022DDAC3F|nr:cupin domain-containing protein [Saprospira grandis]WBM75182.1 cupin domain-containing protein [Saprospira grandis]